MKFLSFLSVGQLCDTIDSGAGASLTACGERGILSLSVNGTERVYRRGLSFTDEMRTFCSPIPLPSRAAADSGGTILPSKISYSPLRVAERPLMPTCGGGALPRRCAPGRGRVGSPSSPAPDEAVWHRAAPRH